MYIYFFSFDLVPLADGILRGLENTTDQLAYLVDFTQFFLQFSMNFNFLAFHLVLHYIRMIFFMNIFLFLGCVPLAGRTLGGLENTTGYRYFVHSR